MAFPVSFDTARLRAERLLPEHTAIIHAMHLDPVQMAPLGGVRTEEQTAAYMERNLRHWDDFGFGIWVLRYTATNAVIGRALLRHLTIDGTDEVEVGYSFAPACWSVGLAPEIAAECLRLGREELGLSSIVALTRPDNARSRRVMEKIGMHYERDLLHAEGPHVVYRTRQAALFGSTG